MATDTSYIVDRVWNSCHYLRHEGIGYGEYVQQLTYLLFLKMADESSKPPFNKESLIPEEFNWDSLISKSGEALETHYSAILINLAKEKGIIGTIYKKAQNRIENPSSLERLINLVNNETWLAFDVDVKGAIYEGLLNKSAESEIKGAGQYFTPRPLIRAIVEATDPHPGQTIHDPACGTGGFLIVAYDHLTKNNMLDKAQKKFLKTETFSGNDIVDNVARLCAMNMYLHGMCENESPINVKDSLASDDGIRYDIILTNPPFGNKGGSNIGNGDSLSKTDASYERDDFWVSSSNKQLNFIQHVKTILKINGKCAIVVPDNVLFEGGRGETIRKKLLHDFDVHTLLRLPTGLFYAQGVKANVLFFDKKPAKEAPWTKDLWIYDLRTNKHFTLKTSPLTYDELKNFLACYNPGNRHERTESERFKCFSYDEILKRDKVSLDIFWLKDESLEDAENLPDPEVLAQEIVENLESALEQFREVTDELQE